MRKKGEGNLPLIFYEKNLQKRVQYFDDWCG